MLNFDDLIGLFRFIKRLADDDSFVPEKDEYDFPIDHLTNSQRVPASSPNTDSIRINIFGLDNSITQFRIKKFTPLHRLKTHYSEIIGIPKEVLRFRFNGIAISDNHTPASLELEDSATLEVYRQQMGGNQS